MNVYRQFDGGIYSLPGTGSIGVANVFEDVFRVCVTQADAPRPFPNYAFIQEEKPLSAPASAKLVSGKSCLLKTDKWELEVFLSAKKQGFVLKDNKGLIRFNCAGDNTFVFDGEIIKMNFPLEAERQAYGLGEWGECLARIPGYYEMWNTDDSFHQPCKRPYCNIPVMMMTSAKNCGWVMLFVNNPGFVGFDLGLKEIGLGTISVATGDLDMWLICGDSPSELMSKWTELTGRCKRPPLWSLGFHQCRWSYMSQDEVLDIISTFRKKKIPVDAIWLDIDYMQDYRVFTWNKKTFSKPAEMCKKLRQKKVRVVTILDPGVKIEPGDKAFDEGLKDEIFLRDATGQLIDRVVWPGHVHHPDFSSPKTRKWWGKQIKRAVTDVGVAGLWNDMNEPACFGEGPIGLQYPADAIHFDDGNFRSHKALHNVYGMCMARASQEALEAAHPNERPFVLSRSGWAGQQRYSAIWTGDNRSSFSSMPYDIVQVLSMAMSGVPFVGSDIGGFIGNASPELMVRWMEHGVFLPFCRAHSQTQTQRHEPWSFGPDAEAKIKSLIELRYRLLPYLQNAFITAQMTGRPVVRPLVYDSPEDKTVRTIGNEFMFGDSLLIAPVLEPGVDSRAVYLPAGKWYHWYSGESRTGGKWFTESAPLGMPPVYVKAGSLIMMGDVIQSTDDKSSVLYCKLYPSEDVATTMVYREDDGLSFDYLKGKQYERSIEIGKMEKSDKSVTMHVGAATGKYHTKYSRIVLQVAESMSIGSLIIDGMNCGSGNHELSFYDDSGAHRIKIYCKK
ncbi:glycoside hydrolase family 31 protein [Candidatus Sumerlaeota bacterium]|nr:glycoside hydrolase family 31 protein [Candidatus Sumerlaeota bacterium]